MKNFLRHIAITFTLLVFLFSISGFTIYRHECLISGKVSLSLVALKDCCEKKVAEKEKVAKNENHDCCKKENKKSSSKSNCENEKTEVKKKDKCCSHTSFTKQLKTDFSFSSQKINSDQIVTNAVSTKQVVAIENSSEKIISYTDPSPPLSGRNILIRIQSFII